MELSQVKQNLNTVVSYNNTRKNKKTNEIFYQAELADIKARSVLIARLSDIRTAGSDEFE